MPIGPVVHTVGKKQIWKKNPLKGFPDIAGVLSSDEHFGKLFVLEIKTDKGKLKPEQKQWLIDLSENGVACAVIRSVDDVVEVMIDWGEVKVVSSNGEIVEPAHETDIDKAC